MIKKIYLWGLLTVIMEMWGCQNNTNIILQNATKIIDIQTYTDTTSIKCVPLETKEECLIGQVKQLLITDHHIFIVNRSPDRVYMFDREGKFIRRIGSAGRGPAEYLNVENIDVNEKKEEIVLYDIEECRALRFDYQGHFLSSFSNAASPYGNIIYLNDSLFALENSSNRNGIENNPKILILNDSGNIVNTFIHQPKLINKKSIIPTSWGFFSKNNTGSYYIPLGTDTIYRLSQNGKNEMICTLGIQQDMFPMDVSQADYDAMKQIKFGPISEFHITNEGTFVGNVSFQGRPVELMGTLKDKIKLVGLTTSKANAFPGLTHVETSFQDYFVGMMSATTAIQFKDKFPDLGEDSNPVIVFLKYVLP